MDSANYSLAWANLEAVHGFAEATKKEKAYSINWLSVYSDLPDTIQAKRDFALALATHNGV